MFVRDRHLGTTARVGLSATGAEHDVFVGPADGVQVPPAPLTITA